MTIPEFPLDLVQETIGHLRDDKPTLAASCLVSKEWRLIAVIHLFSAIRIRNRADLDQWQAITGRTPSLATRTLQEIFFRPDQIKGSPGYATAEIPSIRSSHWSIAVQKFTWKLHGEGESCLKFDLQLTKFMSLFLGITELQLYNLHRTHPYDLAKFIDLLPQLNTLELQGIYLTKMSLIKESTIPACRFTHLKRLYFDETVIDWLDLFMGRSPPSSLVSLSFEHDFELLRLKLPLARIVDLTADSLEYLRVNFYMDPHKINLFTCMERRLKKLRHLDISAIGDWVIILPAILPDMLPVIPSHLDEITVNFIVRTTTEASLIKFDWKHLISTLIPKFHHLTLIFIPLDFEDEPVLDSKSTGRLVRKLLPDLQSRLTVKWGDQDHNLRGPSVLFVVEDEE
ncbi:hypothetical protein C8J56DRAFT_1165558 [Mycena floridula]|nr:hypothetical protein C8J56DRAFT_1165558 [Mycena floridula]